MEKIELDFSVNDKAVTAFVVNELTFAKFSALVEQAQNIPAGSKSFKAMLRRVQMAGAVTYYNGDTVVKIDPDDVVKLPPHVGVKISRAIDAADDTSESGELTSPKTHDGISNSITFRLGTPIQVGAGKDPIKELEFLASTYGEIEDIMVDEDNPLAATKTLLTTIAKPVASTLQLLPSWAYERISFGDGAAISRLVLPRFFGKEE